MSVTKGVRVVLYITKRDGQRVLFDDQKIANAISKAFAAVEGSVDSSVVRKLTDQVSEVLKAKYPSESVPSVEHTQDIVENVLLKSSYIDVARAYIRYRAKHEELREQKTLEQINEKAITLRAANGETVPFKSDWITRKLTRLAGSLDIVDVAAVTQDVCRNVYNNMPLDDVDTLILNAVKQRIEFHYNYSFLTSRLVLDALYQEVLGAGIGSDAMDGLYAEKFATYISHGIELELLNPELAEFDLEKIAAAILPERDMLFQYLGTQTLEDRYLLRERDGRRRPFELPQWLWMRVAMGMALKEEEKEKWAIEFYNVLSQLHLVSSTPTLFNSGTTHSQMSSCYLNTVDDSMEGIFKNFHDDAMLSKWAGGIGTSWTNVRAKNAMIHGTNGTSQGIVPFIKIFNDVALAVNQGGKRKGAMAAYLEVWHSDLDEFLELKKNTGDERRRAHDIHTAVFINDLFMKRVQSRGKWTLFSPDQVRDLADLYGAAFEKRYEEYEAMNLSSSRTMDALEVWRKILTMLYETGHPWITFKDPMNVRSPQDHVGTIHNSNLCTEITLNTSQDETAVCNLASLNMSRMVRDGKIDDILLRKTVTTGVRMLDNVIDNNYYPIPEAENANMRHRPVGLGVMGYQDALYQLGIDFDSEENVNFADESMELISHAAILASSQLAKEKGAYESFPGSKWDRGILPFDTIDMLEQERGDKIDVSRQSKLDWTPVRESIKAHGMRNSNCMAIAPTATISNIAGCVPCVEPTFKNIYMKENLSGNFTLINRFLVDELMNRGIWNQDLLTKIKVNNGSVVGIDDIPAEIQRRYKETFEIDSAWILEAAARRTKWIDQSASTNIFMSTTSGKILSDAYQRAWKLGLKTTYYLRTLAASQVTKTAAIEAEKAVQQTVENAAPLKACSITDPDCEACQ